MVADLYAHVRWRIGLSKWKHRGENATRESIEAEIDAEINAMSNIELLQAISLELTEMTEDAG